MTTINYDNNDGSETGQWPVATTSTATKWGHNDNNDKYDSRERRGIKTARTTTARARTMTARTTTARTIGKENDGKDYDGKDDDGKDNDGKDDDGEEDDDG